jgi:C-terminal processing protease CtpA/Prc
MSPTAPAVDRPKASAVDLDKTSAKTATPTCPKEMPSVKPASTGTEEKAYVGMFLKGNLISKVFKGSPADKECVKAGDKIMAIDGKTTCGLSATEIGARLIGIRSTSVEVVLERGDEQQNYFLVRAEAVPEEALAIREQLGLTSARVKQ